VSVTVLERKVDGKRRVTLPSILGLKEGSKVVMVASPDSAIIAPDRRIAENLAKALHKLEMSRKLVALKEWEKMIAEAGLSGLTSESVDRAVAGRIQRPKYLNAQEARDSD